MKKLLPLLFALAAMVLASCGGTYSVASGAADKAQLSITASDKYSVSVTIDGQAYEMLTVEQKAYKQRKMRATAKNTISIPTGQHSVTIMRDGKVVFDQQIFVSTGQHKVIEL